MYTQQSENSTTSRQAVSVTPATTASNDRKQVAQIAILFGLLIGGVIGVAAVLAFGVPRLPIRLSAMPTRLTWLQTPVVAVVVVACAAAASMALSVETRSPRRRARR